MLIGSVSPLEKPAVGAEPPPSGLRDAIVCSDLESDVERLQCYDDEAVQRGVRRGKDPDAAAADVVRPPLINGQALGIGSWQEHGLFSIRPHKQVYLLPVRDTTNVNNQPSSPTQGTIPQSVGV